MQKFAPESKLRNKYVSDVPIYAECVNCHVPYTHGPNHPEARMLCKSQYPYCMTCLKKNAQDLPEFHLVANVQQVVAERVGFQPGTAIRSLATTHANKTKIQRI